MAKFGMTAGTVVQECGVGLVPLRVADGRLAFQAPAFRREGEVEAGGLKVRKNISGRPTPVGFRRSFWSDLGVGNWGMGLPGDT